MSLELEMMYQSFLDNEVPQMWTNVAYPSMKALGSWIQDLIARCSFLDTWIKKGQPESFWLPGFFFPQGFLTGTLQTHARKYNLPIDHLSFQYAIIPEYYQQLSSPDSTEETVEYSFLTLNSLLHFLPTLLHFCFSSLYLITSTNHSLPTMTLFLSLTLLLFPLSHLIHPLLLSYFSFFFSYRIYSTNLLSFLSPHPFCYTCHSLHLSLVFSDQLIKKKVK
ncbi:DNAH [Acanthosepion pharaonis]|uniref:DNAH n=1 Tax=Acanthosepion pharaonis TaxID=158019 RepID=A0A812EJJ2_ACAPH|nr:DNAH [Sepia pharaonis]